jgi:hypothetical protein
MGSCTWTRINKVTKVLSNETGTLFEIQQRSCDKQYPANVSYPNTYSCKQREISKAVYSAVYCSFDHPTVAFKTDSGDWSVRYLSFDDDHDSHAVHWDNRLYFLICHNFDVDDGSRSLGKIGTRFGYHPIKRVDYYDEDSKFHTIEEVAGPPMGPHALGVSIHFEKGENCWDYTNTVHGYDAMTFYGRFLPHQRITANLVLFSPDRFKEPVAFRLKEDMYVNGPSSGNGHFGKPEDPSYYTGSAGQYLFTTDSLDATEQTKVTFHVCAYRTSLESLASVHDDYIVCDTCSVERPAKLIGWMKTSDVGCKTIEGKENCNAVDHYTDAYQRGEDCATYATPFYDHQNGKPIGLVWGEKQIYPGAKSEDGKWTRVWSSPTDDKGIFPYSLKTQRSCG